MDPGLFQKSLGHYQVHLIVVDQKNPGIGGRQLSGLIFRLTVAIYIGPGISNLILGQGDRDVKVVDLTELIDDLL